MTHRDFLEALRELSPLRVILLSGPSILETICDFDRYAVQGWMMTAFTDQYRWDLDLDAFRHLRSHDETHVLSGRRVLYFALRERAETRPFLLIYLFRGADEDFGAARLTRFAALHAQLAAGMEVA